MGDVFGIGAAIQATAQTVASTEQMAAQLDYNNKYLKGVRETNETNLTQAERQNEWNREQWRLENDYNDPAQQVQRLRNAGLSAAAAAQAIEGAGNASPLQSADLSVAQAAQPLTAPPFALDGLNIIGLARQVEDLRQARIGTEMQSNELDNQPSKLFTAQQIQEQTLRSMQQQFEFAAKSNPYALRGMQYDVKSKILNNQEQRVRIKIAKQNLQSARDELNFLSKIRPVQLRQAFQDLAKSYEDTENAKKEGKILDQTFARNSVLSAFDKFGGVPDNFLGRMSILLATGKIKPEDIESNVKNFVEIVNYLVKGISSSLGKGATNILSSLVFGDPISEQDADLLRKKEQWNKKHDKYKDKDDAPMGSRLESPPFDE